MRTFAKTTAAACLLLLASCGRPAVLLIHNGLDGYFISEIYVSDAGASELGEDLQNPDLEPGQTARFEVPAGTYDILAVDSDGGNYSFKGIVLSGDSASISVTESDLDVATRTRRAEQAMNDCRANMRSLSVAEQLYYGQYGGTGTLDELMASGVMGNAADLSCPSDTTGAPYDLRIADDSSFVIRCPASPALGHGSVVDGAASWQ